MFLVGNGKNTKEFIIDSGCTKHITNDVSYLDDVKKSDGVFSVAKNGQTVASEGVGPRESCVTFAQTGHQL